MTTCSLERISIDRLEEWEAENINQTVFQTSSWLKFLEMDQGIEVVILEVCQNGIVKGIFVGGTIQKLGLKILGSPFEGWMTGDMGFIVLKDDFDYREAILAVRKYAYDELNCWFVQIKDKKISPDITVEGAKKAFSTELELDLVDSQDDIFNSFKKTTRKMLRQFNRRGAVVRSVDFDEDFVSEFYEELKDVFAKQDMVPPYDKSKLLHMVKCLDKKMVYALKVEEPDGKTIASSITFGLNKWAYTMQTASYRKYQKYLPNETLRWEAIKYWKNKGCIHCDFCGYREYKMKFNPHIVKEPIFMMERVPGLIYCKNKAKRLVAFLRKINA